MTQTRSQKKHMDVILIRLFQRIERFIIQPLSWKKALAIVSSFPIAMFISEFIAGSVYINNLAVDYFFNLDALWRLDQKQVPYRDFITPIGPVYYDFLNVTKNIYGSKLDLPTKFLLLPALIGGPLLLWIAWYRLPSKLAFLIASVMTLRLISPRFIDNPFTDVSFIGLYNSLGIFLLTMILIGNGFQSKNTPWEGILIGICITLLLFLKINLGIIAIASSAIGWLCISAQRRMIFIAMITTFCTSLIYGIIHKNVMGLYWNDLVLISKANDWNDRSWIKIENIVQTNFNLVMCSLVVFWMLEKERQRTLDQRSFFVAISLFFSTWLVVLNNHENYPLLLILFFLKFYQMSKHSFPLRNKIGSIWRRTRTLLYSSPLLGMMAWTGINDIGSVLMYAPQAIMTKETKLESIPGDIPLKIQMRNNGVQEYIETINKGILLIKKHQIEKKRILLGDFINVYPYLLSSTPPKKTLAWLDAGRTFSYKSHPNKYEMLENTDVIMINKTSAFKETRELFWNLYGREIEKSFKQIENTPEWNIYKK